MYGEQYTGLGFWGALIGGAVSLFSKKKSSPSSPAPIAARKRQKLSRRAKGYASDTARLQRSATVQVNRMNLIIATERQRRAATRGLLPLAIAGGVVMLMGGLLLRRRR